MNTRLSLLSLLVVLTLCLFITSCNLDPVVPKSQPEPEPVVDEAVFCISDVKECPDGTFVIRVPPNCDFDQCPAPRNEPESGSECIEDYSYKEYVGNSPGACDVLEYNCVPGMKHFEDSCGCGCEPDTQCNAANRTYKNKEVESCSTMSFNCPVGDLAFFDSCGCGCEEHTPASIEAGVNECSVQDRLATCESRGAQVCGVSVDGTRRTYTNPCFACRVPDVDYWVDGTC